MMNGSTDEATKNYVRKRVTDLYENRINFGDMIMSTSLSKDVDDYVSVTAAVQVAKNRMARDPDDQIYIGVCAHSRYSVHLLYNTPSLCTGSCALHLLQSGREKHTET